MSSEYRQDLYGNPPYSTQQPMGGANPPPPPPPPAYNTGQLPGQQGYFVQQQTFTSDSTTDTFRKAIPELPMCLAVTYCIINCIIPGIGTILAAFSLLCCGNIGQSSSGKFGTFCINFWVGIAQLLLIPFGVGWVWSVFWGMAFIAIAAEANKNRQTVQTVTVTQQNLPGAPTIQTKY